MHDLLKNRVLAALPAAWQQRWAAQLESVALEAGQTLHEPGEPLAWVYFPLTALLSLQGVVAGDHVADLALIGHDGVVGAAQLLGTLTMPCRTHVLLSGQALRLERAAWQTCMEQDRALRQLMEGYAQSVMGQMVQSAACRLSHTPRQKVSRWLLVALDRVPSPPPPVTRALMASVTGVRSPGMGEAMAELQAEGVLNWGADLFTSLDRARLEAGACRCHVLIRQELDALVPRAAGG
jgi:CRP-like cAMP-binding protein